MHFEKTLLTSRGEGHTTTIFSGCPIENGEINGVYVESDGTWRDKPEYTFDGGAICEHPSMYISYINEQISQFLFSRSCLVSWCDF